MQPIPIPVELDGRRPRRLRLGSRWHRVRDILEMWVVQGQWWHAEEQRVYMRLATDRAVVEVYRTRDAWHLARILD